MGKYDKGGDVRSDDRYKPVPKKEMNKRAIIDNLLKPSNLALIANAIEGVCSRPTFNKYMRDDPEFASEITLIQQAMDDQTNDLAEGKLKRAVLGLEKMDKGQAILSIFYAKTKLKHRGYNEGKDQIKEEEQDKLEINYHIPAPKQIDNIEDIDHEDIKDKEDGE
jgi:pantoate kinase